MADYVGRRLGNYQISRLLGAGAFAQVYLAEHIYLNTQAAIKILNAQVVGFSVEMFLAEARTIARFVHPNIVRVLEFGVEAGTPFLVLDYAPNGTLRQRHPLGQRLPLTTVVSYTQQTADALQYAHDEKLVHRDVKPENMLLGRRNELLLSDFGIALMVQTMSAQQFQNIAGTLAYMAPEQIQGQPRPASDQYSLAIIVYEWLTGSRPFSGSVTELISQQLAVSPTPLRQLLPALSPAVEEVVLTALSKDPVRRFRTVTAFAQALAQASQSSTVTPGSVTGSIALSPPATPSTNSGARLAAEPAVSSLSGARETSTGTVVCVYRGHKQGIRSLAWSPDSMRIVSASNEKKVHVWDATNGNELQSYQDIAPAVQLVAWSSDGARIATAGLDARIRIWDFATNRLIATYQDHSGQTIQALAWSPRLYFLASTATDGSVHVWDTTLGQPLAIYRGHSGSVNTLAWFPNTLAQPSGASTSYYIASAGDDGTVQAWEALTGKTLARYQSQPGKITSVDWSPSSYPPSSRPGPQSSTYYSSRIGCGKADGTIQMWDTAAGSEVLSYRYLAPITVVAWSPNGTRFAYASRNSNIEAWDTATNRKLITLSHGAPIYALAWSPDGLYLASGAEDATIQIYVAP